MDEYDERNKKRRFSSKVSLVALSLVVAAGIFIAVQIGKIGKDSKSILEQQRFIVVDDSGDENLYRSYFENGYDLRSNNSYSKTQVVVKNGENMAVIRTKNHPIGIIETYTEILLPQF
ncbi:hypothetical protein SD436_09545 [Streptococcus sp. 2A/TPW/M5]